MRSSVSETVEATAPRAEVIAYRRGQIARAAARLRPYLLELRPHQWIKNLLVFVPLAAVHGLADGARLKLCLAAFAAFCLAASSIYLLNDLTDVEEDRHDPQKLERPLAGGQLTAARVWTLLLALLAAAAALAWSLRPEFLGVLAAYYLLMCAYSLVLKHIVVADILTIAGGYSLRVTAGAAVLQIRPSAWLIALCGSLFMSLALLKRYAELVGRERLGSGSLRGYVVADAPILAIEGIASGYVSVLVLALYTTTDLVHRMHGRPERYWLLCGLLLYWINYMWLMARRGRVPHDPVMYALRDRTSTLLVAAMAAAAMFAVWG